MYPSYKVTDAYNFDISRLCINSLKLCKINHTFCKNVLEKIAEQLIQPSESLDDP